MSRLSSGICAATFFVTTWLLLSDPELPNAEYWAVVFSLLAVLCTFGAVAPRR